MIIIVILTGDCKNKEEILFITYPAYGDYGANIIRLDSVMILSGSSYIYSLRAELPAGTSLKLIMKNKSLVEAGRTFSAASKLGWGISPYSNDTKSQQFIAYGQVICDLWLYF